MIINFNKLKESFQNAFYGLRVAFLEHTFRVLSIIAFAVLTLAVVLPLSPLERGILFLLVASVLSFELINSQIERILDILHPDYKEKVRIIKDISAGAVLLMSIASAIIGTMILLPYFF